MCVRAVAARPVSRRGHNDTDAVSRDTGYDARVITPELQRLDENAGFLAAALGGRRRVLEVGCGRGAVAQALAERGFEVTALDLSLRDPVDAPAVRFVEIDFLQFDDGPFDAIAFTASLHHITPLDAAIDRAVRLLVPGGRLIADEFDRDAPDVETLRWYYETQELLVAAERYDAEHVDHGRAEHGHGHVDHGHDHAEHGHADPVARWHHAHHHHQPLHTGAAMLEAIASRFVVHELHRFEYLHRYIGRRLPQDAIGARIAEHVRTTEQNRIASGTLRAVGLRVIADLAVEG